ncbi:TPA: RES domain-containing protein, partial [Clostridioides difficile]
KEIIKKKINKYLIYIYLKLISDYIFELVETDNAKEKEYEYAPFHVFANYIQNKRYNGIIFRSTRNSSGKNLVLFNPTYVNPKGNIYLYKISGTKSTFIEEVKSVNKNYTIDI